MSVIPVLADQPLSFLDIERHSCSDWPKPSAPNEILGELFKAWWLGDLVARNGPSRLVVLLELFEHHQNHIAFESPGGESPPPHMLTENGGLLVIHPVAVRVPNLEPETWSDKNCEPAFEDLAGSWPLLQKEFVDRIGLIEISRDRFFSLLARLGPWLPGFWGQPPEIRRAPKYVPEIGPRTPAQVTEAIQRLYAAGHRPSETETLKDFIERVRLDLGLPDRKSTKGLSESNVKRIIRALRRQG